jgi:hypothetical protein
MGDETPKARHWAFPLMFGILAFALTWYYGPRLLPWLAWTGFGMAAVFGSWSLFNLGHQAVAVWGGVFEATAATRYRVSANDLAEKIQAMSGEQLQVLRMFGSTVIQTLITDDDLDDRPVEIIFGTQVSLAFAEYFLSASSHGNAKAIRDFADGTYHWDWTGENKIPDREQAREFTAWLVRYGIAEWHQGNQSASWKTGWSPERVARKLGLAQED